MINLRLERIYKGVSYTIGKLYLNGKYFCDTLEDTDRGLKDTMPTEEIEKIKVYGKTAIPTGTYKVDMNTVSPKFKDRTWAKPYSYFYILVLIKFSHKSIKCSSTINNLPFNLILSN